MTIIKNLPQEEYEQFKAFKTSCFAYAKEHFQGKSFLNGKRKVLIKVSRTGLNEWFSKTKTYEQAESIKYLDEMLKKAVYNHLAKNEHPKRGDELATFDYYDYKLTIQRKNVCRSAHGKECARARKHILPPLPQGYKNRTVLKHDSALKRVLSFYWTAQWWLARPNLLYHKPSKCQAWCMNARNGAPRPPIP